MVHTSPVVAIKCLKVGDFQGTLFIWHVCHISRERKYCHKHISIFTMTIFYWSGRNISVNIKQKHSASKSRPTWIKVFEVLVSVASLKRQWSFAELPAFLSARILFLFRYDSEGKGTTMETVGSNLILSTKTGSRSMYSDRVFLSQITDNPTLGQDKVRMLT